jgi:hypothetical protein
VYAVVAAADTGGLRQYTNTDERFPGYPNASISLKWIGNRGVNSIQGDLGDAGEAAGPPSFSCADISNALYDVNRRVTSAENAIEAVGGYTAKAAAASLFTALYTHAVTGSAANALASDALLRIGVAVAPTAGTMLTSYIDASWNRNIVAGLFRVHNCF